MIVVLTVILGVANPSPVWAVEKAEDPDEILLKEAGFKTDNESLLQFLRDRSPENPRAEVARWIAALSSDKFQERETAPEQLVRLGKIALEPLREAVKSKDVDVLARAKPCLERLETVLGIALPQSTIRLLVKRQPVGTEEIMLRFVPFAEEEDVEVELYYALDALVVKQATALTGLRKGLTDPQPSRRCVAACILARRGTQDDRLEVRKLLKAKEPLVRLRAAQGLLAAHDAFGVATLIDLLTEGDVAISWSAGELLQWAAGDTAPTEEFGTRPIDRDQCKFFWKRWFNRFASHLDLRRRSQSGQRPGLVLISDMDPGKDRLPTVRLWLCGCNGRLLWELPNERSSYMEMLTDNRLLMAGVGVVTEESTEGKVSWKSDCGRRDENLWCRRLPNGITVVWSTQGFFGSIDSFGKVREWIDGRSLGIGTSIHSWTAEYLPCGRLAFIAMIAQEKSYFGHCDCRTGKLLHHVSLETPPGEEILSGSILKNGHPLLRLRKKRGDDLLQPPILRWMEFDSKGKPVVDSGQQSWRRATRELHAMLRNGNALGIRENFEQDQSPPFHVVGEYDKTGCKVWEAFLPAYPFAVKPCLPLVRFGFDVPPESLRDLDSVESRVRELAVWEPLTRYRAAVMLSKQGAKAEEAMPAILQSRLLLDGTRRDTMLNCAFAVRGSHSLSVLLDLAKGKDDVARRLAIQQLWRYPAEATKIVPVLLQALKDRDPALRYHACYSAREFLANQQIVEVLIDKISDSEPMLNSEQTIGIAALIMLRGGGKTPHADLIAQATIRAVESKDRRLACEALQLMGYLGKTAPKQWPRMLGLLNDTLKRTEYDMQLSAARALELLGPDAASTIPTLRVVLKKSLRTSDPAVVTLRFQVLSALAAIGSTAAPAVPEIIAVLSSSGIPDDHLTEAVKVIRAIGVEARSAIPALHALGQSQLVNPTLKKLLSDTIQRISGK